jgi:type IX secretion system PorP/SprF family membrane protein
MSKSTIWVILFMFLPLAVRAQQMPLYSQYVMNAFMINPAIAGSDGYTSFNLTARQQWVGFKDAPSTQSFSAQTRILRKSYVIKNKSINNRSLKPSSKGRVGLGGFLYNDRNGAVDRTGLQFSYAYHIFVGETQLSFGLSAGIFQFRVREDQLSFIDEGDPIAGSLNKVIYVPDANLGFHVLNARYYAGVSVNQLFQSYLKLGNRTLEEYRMIRHYYLLGGYRFDLGSDFDIEPSGLFKATEKKAFQLDIGGRLYFREDYWAGIMYRTSGDIIFLAGIRYKQFYFGYAFDYSTSNIRRYSYGSHEIVLALKLGDSARRYRWLQRY